MDDQTRQALIKAIEDGLKGVGVSSLEACSDWIDKFAEALQSQIKPLCNRERLDDFLKSIEIQEDAALLVRTIAESPMAFFLLTFRQVLPQLQKEVAPINTGRPKALPSEKRRAVCKFISELNEKGISLGTAKQRATRTFSVSLTTIERIWAARKRGHQPTVREAVKMLNANKNPKAT